MTKFKTIFSTVITLLLIVTVCGVIVSIIKPNGDLFGNVLGGVSDKSESDTACVHTLEVVSGQAPTCFEDGWSEYVRCTQCDYNTKVFLLAKGHNIVYVDESPGVSYSCSGCGASFSPESFYQLNGTDHVGMVGKGYNSSYFTTSGENSQLPAIVDGHYEYVKTSTTSSVSQAQMWIPAEASGFTEFSSTNNAVGVLSFKINANVGSLFEMKLVEGHYETRWHEKWSIYNSVFKIAPHSTSEDTVTYSITGIDGIDLKTVNSDVSGFTGWLDVQIGIEFDAESDLIIFHYFINGKYITSQSTALTTQDNSITSVYVNCRTSAQGSGYMIDDIVFGYTENGEWNF